MTEHQGDVCVYGESVRKTVSEKNNKVCELCSHLTVYPKPEDVSKQLHTFWMIRAITETVIIYTDMEI